MPNPLQVVADFLEADLPNLPDDTTIDTDAPSSAPRPVVQFAWDGTPSDADNREDCAIRITVWTDVDSPTLAGETAFGLRQRLLRQPVRGTWRIDRGPGRRLGVDPDSELFYCTFTVYAVMRMA